MVVMLLFLLPGFNLPRERLLSPLTKLHLQIATLENSPSPQWSENKSAYLLPLLPPNTPTGPSVSFKRFCSYSDNIR